VKAERALLARLGDIQVEIQCRERWCQIEHERATGLGPHYPTLPVLESWGLGLVQPMGHMAPTGPHGFVSGPLLSPLRLDGLPQQGDDGLVRNPLEFAPPTTGSCAPPEHEKYDQNRVRTMACDDRPGDIKLVGEVSRFSRHCRFP
jgi:hypothetical protein